MPVVWGSGKTYHNNKVVSAGDVTYLMSTLIIRGSLNDTPKWYKIFAFSGQNNMRSWMPLSLCYIDDEGLIKPLGDAIFQVPLGTIADFLSYGEASREFSEGLIVYGRGICIRFYGVDTADEVFGKVLLQEGHEQ